MQLPSRQDFTAALDSSFDVWADGGEPVEFRLVECKSVLSNETQECYSLIFRGPSDHPPVQDTYFLENDQLGKIQLLLVPIRRDEAGIYFEAVMNHFVTN